MKAQRLNAQKLAQLMKERGLSQSALADKVGTTHTHICRIVNSKDGKRGASFAMACRIADALGVPLDSLR